MHVEESVTYKKHYMKNCKQAKDSDVDTVLIYPSKPPLQYNKTFVAV